MPHRDEPQSASAQEAEQREIAQRFHIAHDAQGGRDGHRCFDESLSQSADVGAVVVKADGHSRFFGRCRDGGRDGPIRRAEGDGRMLATNVHHPRADGGVQLALKGGGERNQFPSACRAAGRHQAGHWLLREHGRLAAPDARDPRLQRVVVHDRHTLAKLIVTANRTEPVRPAKRAVRVPRNETAQNVALRFLRLDPRAAKAGPGRQA